MNNKLLLSVLTVFAFPAVALAGAEVQVLPGWYSRMPLGAMTTNVFSAVDAIDENTLFFGGMNIPADLAGDITNFKSFIYRSQNASETVQDISGIAGGLIIGGEPCLMTDIRIHRTRNGEYESRVGWASCGSFLALSPEGAKFSKKFAAPSNGEGDDGESLTAMHIFDKSSGVVGSSRGNIYLFELSEDGKSVDFQAATVPDMSEPDHANAAVWIKNMYWLDRHTGWAIATAEEEITEQDWDGNETTTTMYYTTHVLKTTDGGREWAELSTLSLPNEDDVHQIEMFSYKGPLTFDGGWRSSDIFMVDETDGFLTLMAWDNQAGLSKVVKVLRTGDGGNTWMDARINMQIGTMKSMFTQPIFFSEAAGMNFWKSEGVIKGRIAGSSFLTEGGSSSGNPPKYFHATVISTDDGGATWTRSPELGDVEYDMMGGGAITKTARIIDVDFLGPYTGFGVGDESQVFRFLFKCTKNSQCDFGYFCDRTELTCKSCAEADPTDTSATEKCAGWEPPPEPDPELMDRDVIDWSDGMGGDHSSLVDAAGGGDSGTGTEQGKGGCSSTGKNRHALPIAVLMAVLSAAILFARRRSVR